MELANSNIFYSSILPIVVDVAVTDMTRKCCVDRSLGTILSSLQRKFPMLRTNININDVLGDYGVTLVDTLDTLAIMGYQQEFENAVNLVARHVSFNQDSKVQVFETNIRALGGLVVYFEFIERFRTGRLMITNILMQIIAIRSYISVR